MGFFELFKNKKNKMLLKEENVQQIQQIVIDNQKNIETREEVIDIFQDTSLNYSGVVSNETIEKIKKINNIEYMSDIMLKRIEKYPELVNLLLEGNISQDILNVLNYYEKLNYLPTKEEDLQILKFVDIDENIQKIVSLLNNRINSKLINDNYIRCYANLKREFETINFQNETATFIPNIKINLGNELLTKIDVYSSFILYLPKTKHKIVYHNYEQFITGNIELNEDTIIQMRYDVFRFLDESIIDKISNCKIIFSENLLNIEEDIQLENELDYKLIKYNHLIYIIEKSSLDEEIKKKLLYQTKKIYTDDIWYFDLELSDKIIPYLNNLDIEEIKKLTEEFELNIEIYKTKKIEKPEFNASYYIDEFFHEFDKVPLNEAINFINSSSEKIKSLLLREPRVLKKLNILDNLDEKKLKKISSLLSKKLSITTIDFVNYLNIDIETFMSNPNNDHQSPADINHIISEYGIFDYVNQEKTISVRDLLGHDAVINCGRYKGKNILYTFENFFEKNGDGYHTRALELLEYKSGEELLRGLEERNHDTLDMKVKQMEEGKYVIAGNGLHRFTVLRFHYLLDCMKKEKSEEELYELYKIPVKLVSTTNFKKTYCNYLLQKANPTISYISFNYKQDEITIYYKSSTHIQVINEEELINLTIQSIEMLDYKSLSEITQFYNQYASFHQFIDTYIPNLLNKIEANNERGVKR